MLQMAPLVLETHSVGNFHEPLLGLNKFPVKFIYRNKFQTFSLKKAFTKQVLMKNLYFYLGRIKNEIWRDPKT